MNKIPYSPDLVGISPENVFLDDYVCFGMARKSIKNLTVPVMKGKILVGTQKKSVACIKESGMDGLVTSDLLVQRGIKSGLDFISTPRKGGFDLDFGDYLYFTRKAKPKEFSSIHAHLVKEGGVVYNHAFIQKQFYQDFLASNSIHEWRMPFSPNSSSSFAVSWRLIDPVLGKFECVTDDEQKPSDMVRLKHFFLSDPKAHSVNIVQGEAPSYDVGTHTFTVTPGSRIQLFFINSPLGQKEWSDEVELDIDSNTINFI